MLLVMLDPVTHRSNVARHLLGDGGIVSLLFVEEDNGPALLSGEVAVSRSVTLEQRLRRGIGCCCRRIGRLSVLLVVTVAALAAMLVLSLPSMFSQEGQRN